MATIQEVADMANVSVATVSRVINGSSSVKEDTKIKVMRAVRALDYQPNLLGINLRRAKTSLILVLIPDISNPFYSTMVKGIEDVANENSYNVMLCNTENKDSRALSYMNMLNYKLADGAITMGLELTSDKFQPILKKHYIIQCCEYIADGHASYVTIDNFSAAQKAVVHLLNLGHRKIAFIKSKGNYISNLQREDGYIHTLKSAGIEINRDYIISIEKHDYKDGLRAVQHILQLNDIPTAVFACSDIIALGVLKGLKNNNIRVPEDMAVIGVDDIDFASVSNPTLTTIAQPKYDLGKTAMNLLLEELNTQKKNKVSVNLEYELIIRESTVR